jgi:TrmH family RNA methyltransferase
MSSNLSGKRAETMSTSSSNSLIKRIRKLEQKKFRMKDGSGFVEGLRGVLTAAEYANHLIEKVIIAPDLLTQDQGAARLHELVESELMVEVSAEVFRSLSDRDNPAGMGALVRSPLISLPFFSSSKPNSLFIILDRVSDPGNLGTIIRTADAVGAAGIILTGLGVDIMHPSALKASLGTAFTLPICHTTPHELASWKIANNVSFVGTSAKKYTHYKETELRGSVGLLLGNEREGLSDELINLADQVVTIPMAGQASSLNLAVAAGILMFEFQR